MSFQTTDAISVSLFVPGIPVPKGSRTVGQRKNGSVYTRPANANEKPWKEAVATVAKAHRPAGKTVEPPYVVSLVFYMPRPDRPKYDWPVKSGDLDKLERAVLDGLTQGGLIVDDRHVVELHSCKEFAGTGPGGVSVTVARG